MNRYVLCTDPGLATFGAGLIRLGKYDTVERMGYHLTEPSAKKLRVLSCDDVSRRAAELSNWLDAFIGDRVIVGVASEAFSPPRNASSAGKISRSFGILDRFTATRGIPFSQVTPQAIKKRLTGRQNASKADIIDAVCAGAVDDSDGVISEFLDTTPKSHREHPFDALGAFVVVRDQAEWFKAIKAVLA